jgi:hypothetical protein
MPIPRAADRGLDGLRASLAKDRSQFYKDLAVQFYGANRPGAKVSQGVLDQFWLWSMQSGLKNAYESIKAFSETDFTEDLQKFDVPTLVPHGEDDQIVPVKDSARKSARLIKARRRSTTRVRRTALRPRFRTSSTRTYSPSWEADLHQHRSAGLSVRKEGEASARLAHTGAIGTEICHLRRRGGNPHGERREMYPPPGAAARSCSPGRAMPGCMSLCAWRPSRATALSPLVGPP